VNSARSEAPSATYSRDIQKWLLVAPIIGVLTGLITAAITILILQVVWAALLPYYLAHHWAIVAGLVSGFFVTGLIMQYCTARERAIVAANISTPHTHTAP
jgi:CIC family chloride channel protein